MPHSAMIAFIVAVYDAGSNRSNGSGRSTVVRSLTKQGYKRQERFWKHWNEWNPSGAMPKITAIKIHCETGGYLASAGTNR